MKHTVTVDTPDIEAGVAFYTWVFGLEEVARPLPVYAVLKSGAVTLGIMEKPEGSQPAPDTDNRRRCSRHWTPVHIDIEMEAFDATLERLPAAGGTCEQRFDIEGHPKTAFCADPIGNGFCLMEIRG